jgi:cellulose biosynthesis protein BcsQ
MDPVARLGRILTFYSYKGGTGRSMALANIAWLLAASGRRVLAIDWDLEAPGLHRYFLPFLIDGEVTATEGLIDLIDNYANEAIRPLQNSQEADPEWYLPYTDFSNYIVSINFPHFGAGGKIDFLPAGRQGEHYALAVNSFNWQNFYDRLGGGGFFEAVKQQARAQYDYVLIDSRTGVSDTAGICSVQMPDALVVCFTYNNQSIKGASAVARSAVAMHEKLVEEKLALHRAGKVTATAAMFEDATRP